MSSSNGIGTIKSDVKETYSSERYKSVGILLDFVHDNNPHSRKGVLLCLNFQRNLLQKLVPVSSGSLFDVEVDIRVDSLTFANAEGVELGTDNKHKFYVAQGDAYGFAVTFDTVNFEYKCTDFYYQEDEGALLCTTLNGPSTSRYCRLKIALLAHYRISQLLSFLFLLRHCE